MLHTHGKINYGGLNKECPLYTQHSNIWSLVGAAISGGLEAAAFLEEVCQWEWVLKIYSLDLLSIFFPCFILVIKDMIIVPPTMMDSYPSGATNVNKLSFLKSSLVRMS